MRRLLPSLSLWALATVACSGPAAAPKATATRPSPGPLAPAASAAAPLDGPATAAPAAPLAPGGTGGSPAPGVVPSLAPLGSPLPAPTGALVGQVFAPAALLTAAGLVANHGASIVSNHAGGLVSDQGGGIVSNHGSGLIANHGASYRLLALERQVAAAGALVRLVDAAGQPWMGPDGLPLEARTDALGRYAFPTAPPQHAIARVELGTQGRLEALVVPGVREVGIELSSSLVASYVMSQYVSPQAKPLEVLARLPAEVEAQTRREALLALDASQAPPDLAPATVASSVEGLRQARPAFDAQLEAVKKLLLAAGVANLGSGRPGTEVYMGRIDRVVPGGPGGVMALYTPNDHRVWGLNAAGQLLTLAGSGVKRQGAAAGFAAEAKAAELDHLWGLAWDRQGRLWALEHEVGLWRLEGGQRRLLLSWATLSQALGGNPFGSFALGPDDSVWQVSNGKLHRWREGEAAPSQVAAVPGLGQAMNLAVLPDGGLIHQRFGEYTHILAGSYATQVAFDPVASGAMDSVAGHRNDLGLDPSGHVLFVAQADGRLHAWRPGEPERVGPLRSGLKTGLFKAALDPQGRFLAVDIEANESEAPSVLRLGQADGSWTILAGRDRYPNDFAPNGEFSLQGPSGLDVAADGTMWIADFGALLKVKPQGGGSEVVLPSGQSFLGQSMQITGVRLLGGDRLGLRLSGSSLEALAERSPEGGLSAVVSSPKEAGNLRHTSLHAWDAHPTHGWAWAQFSQANFPNTTVALYRRPPGASQPELVVPTTAGIAEAYKLRIGPDGALWLLGTNAQRQLKRWVWRPAEGLQEAPATAAIPDAVDAQGRAWEGGAPTYVLGDASPGKIWRQAPSGPPLQVAGPGTSLLPGPGLDEGIGSAADLRFDGQGALYYRDPKRRIVRRIPRDRLP